MFSVLEGNTLIDHTPLEILDLMASLNGEKKEDFPPLRCA
jgi:hypothetical protein